MHPMPHPVDPVNVSTNLASIKGAGAAIGGAIVAHPFITAGVVGIVAVGVAELVSPGCVSEPVKNTYKSFFNEPKKTEPLKKEPQRSSSMKITESLKTQEQTPPKKIIETSKEESYDDLKKENEELKNKVKILEMKLNRLLKIQDEEIPELSNENVNEEEMIEEYLVVGNRR